MVRSDLVTAIGGIFGDRGDAPMGKVHAAANLGHGPLAIVLARQAFLGGQNLVEQFTAPAKNA